MAAYVPPGWPAGVHPPGSEEFEQTAITWLLDAVPPDYRLHGVLRRHPLALAVLARHHLAACVQGARAGYRTARTELASLPPGGVDAVLEVYRAEGRRLVETARAVDLVGRALRGEVFTPQLGHQRPSAPLRAAAAPREPAARQPGAAEAPAREAGQAKAARPAADSREPAPPATAPQRGPARAEDAAHGHGPAKGAARERGPAKGAARERGPAKGAARERGPAKGAARERGPAKDAGRGAGAAEKPGGAGRRAAKSGQAS